MTDASTILVLRALGLGDFFTGLPALRVLRQARPGARIVLAAPRSYAPLAELAGTVDDLVHGHELDPLEDPPHRPDLAVDLHGNGPASRQLLIECAPKRLLAFNDGGPVWRADEHEVSRWCRLLAEGLPTDLDGCPPAAGCLPVPEHVAMPSGKTLVHCGAKAAARRWPADRFVAVAQRLAAEGHDVVATGGPEEAETVRAVASASGAEASYSMSLLELLVLVASARLLVCGDTGVAHIASNYRTPSVVLFGPVSPAVWGPPADERHQVLWHGSGDGDPHADRPDPALLRIGVDEVVAATRRALAAAPEEVTGPTLVDPVTAADQG